MTNFYHLNNDAAETLVYHDIPFKVEKNDGIVKAMDINAMHYSGAKKHYLNQKCEALFFLGMTTSSFQCSEWWAQKERNYDYSRRLFIGDRIGKIHIIYDDRTEDLFSILFGVNVWNYDLFEKAKDWEKGISSWGGPFREPFESDKEAEKLFYNCMQLMENTGETVEKNTKWVFGIKVNPNKVIKSVRFSLDESKEAGFNVSSVTALAAGEEIKKDWKIIDLDYFLSKKYYANVDKLSRRLYQFRDELPQKVDAIVPLNYDAPKVKFKGNGFADIFTNVFSINIMDMAYIKVDDTGRTHTSSKNPYHFGCYIGMGTFNQGTCYYDHVWTRDVGRGLMEICNVGYFDRCNLAVEDLHKLLYYPSTIFKEPHWKRIANMTENDGAMFDNVQGKENDGHASAMLAIYTLYNKGGVDVAWLKEHHKQLFDAANWFVWQIENPAESNFDRVLYSNSEASTQIHGGYDLFSNILAVSALRAYVLMFEDMGDEKSVRKFSWAADIIYNGCKERFVLDHPRFGKVFTDTTDDCWTYEYKRFADLFIKSDLYGYDVFVDDYAVFEMMNRTFDAQLEDFYYPEAGRQMGYGQGYLTETVLMLDRYKEMTDCVEAASMFCYHHTDVPYIVPEGVIIHGSKRFWYRNSDLGNAVQQAEIIKVARLIIGLDDISKKRGLRIIPRLPDTWNEISVIDYPVTTCDKETVTVSYCYKRLDNGFEVNFKAEKEVLVDFIRVGPFPGDTSGVSVEGTDAAEVKLVRINDRNFAYIYFGKENLELKIKIS